MVASSWIMGQQRSSRNCENGTALQRSDGKKSPPLTLRSCCDWSWLCWGVKSETASFLHCPLVCVCVYMQWHREVWNFFLPLLFSLSLCTQPIPITMATSSLVEQAAGYHRNISAVPWCAMVWYTCFTVILRRACALEGVLLERGHGCSGQLHKKCGISRHVEITHISVGTSQTSCICKDMQNNAPRNEKFIIFYTCIMPSETHLSFFLLRKTKDIYSRTSKLLFSHIVKVDGDHSCQGKKFSKWLQKTWNL